MARSHTITGWDPEDRAAWDAGGEGIAKRNLAWSVAAEHVGFSVWSLWSVMVLFMPESVYHLNAGDKFLIAATATLVGSVLRLPYTMATARFGGRNWTVFSACVLIVPVVATIVILANPGQPLWVYLLCAALTGLGGGNFASSMTNINAFFPQRLKGWALGLNAGGGNIGVPAVQLVGLLVIAVAGNREPYWVCVFYVVALTVAAIGARRYMNNLDIVSVDTASMKAALRHRHTWLVSLLYIGTFGSFIGFSFAFGQVLQISFTDGGQTAAQASLHAAQIAFIGPLLGSVARVYGGKFADRIGGGRVTLWAFAGMIGGAGILAVTATIAGRNTTAAAMALYVLGFVLLFLLSGIGNGSVYKMIPSIFEAASRSLDVDEKTRADYSRAMSGAVIGIAGAVGGLGGVAINLVLRASYLANGTATVAFWAFGAFYVIAALVTWRVYVRLPQTAAAESAVPAAARG
ncbi:NarK/NasA family nitrate transporter [Tsukamurella sp. 8F]|uniref:nitrate/nitrite transporter n=1 Tax=unclassified Tsukamurella TaxID=2633480 RepID=UPI0023BA2CBD|nr:MULTISPECIES: nitrate/nitrite transporter [unclassified Tsukamurella]MDF0528834.1 NarK/NasA family nitrate transporter [Tsukamurella sp. 8J]MDF0586669.1 NarK/NasA family nitrate transporter [Tsukamurella sp. 8F]